MSKYGYLQGIVMSFYSRDFYRDVVQNWSAGVFLYLLLILAFCLVSPTIHIQKGINVGYNAFSEKIFPQIPVMTFKSGELTTPDNRPYEIVDSNKNVIVLIDTSGKHQDFSNTEASVLLTKHAILFHEKSGDTKTYHYSKGSLQIDPTAIQQVIGKVIDWTWVILFPILLLLFFIYRVLISVLYAVLGKILALLLSVQLTFPEVYKIVIFATTPTIILGTLFNEFQVSFHGMWLFYFVLSMGYILFGIVANKSTKKVK